MEPTLETTSYHLKAEELKCRSWSMTLNQTASSNNSIGFSAVWWWFDFTYTYDKK